MLVAGDSGSGRSTFLRTLACSIAQCCATTDVHIYGIDCGSGALQPLTNLPHCGAVVTRLEPDRVSRLLARTLDEIAARQRMFSEKHYATILDQRRAAPVSERLPYITLLLDRWEGFVNEFDQLDAGQLVADFMQILKDGLGVGVRVILTGDRSTLNARFTSLMDQVIVLRMNDRTTYSLADLNPRILPDKVGPGRAFRARSGTEIQVALVDDDPSGPSQALAFNRLAAEVRDRDSVIGLECRPLPIEPLPTAVALSTVLAAGCDAPPRERDPVLIGVGGDAAVAQWLDLDRVGQAFVIVGASRSGRSNALSVMTHSLTMMKRRLVVVVARPTPLTLWSNVSDSVTFIDARITDVLPLELGTSTEQLHVILDDVDLLADAPIAADLQRLMLLTRDTGSRFIGAGPTTEMVGSFKPLIQELRKTKSALILSPTLPTDGEIVGAKIPRSLLNQGAVGRSILIQNRTLLSIQVPLDDVGVG
jgi:S-DNA-T family DNA segregation ATPase FtsK/SpoIIIE